MDIVSDVENYTLPDHPGPYRQFINAVKHGCSSTDREFGLICKNNIIFRKWMWDADMASKKWFFRFMDDTWAHLENIYDYLSTLDHRKPYEKFGSLALPC